MTENVTLTDEQLDAVIGGACKCCYPCPANPSATCCEDGVDEAECARRGGKCVR